MRLTTMLLHVRTPPTRRRIGSAAHRYPSPDADRCSEPLSASIRSQGQACGQGDIVTTPGFAVPRERLEAGDVVATLQSQSDAAKPKLAAECAVAQEMRPGVDVVEIPVLVRPATRAETDKRSEVQRSEPPRMAVARASAPTSYWNKSSVSFPGVT